MRFLLIACLFFPVCVSFPQKARDHAAVVPELADKISHTTFAKKPVRLAIVTFVPTTGNASAVNAYGEYLTESIIGKLSENAALIKVYERKRLDAILKENEWMLSGMMKPSEALKIGELLPIDALFSGTYTKLKSYIDVSGRLIDVTTGEILMTYSGRVKLTKNLKSLFPADDPGATNQEQPATVIIQQNKRAEQGGEPKLDDETFCKQKVQKFREKLHDLSTPEKVDAVVAESMKTPFDNSCGKLHYHLIDALMRYSILHDEYEKFLGLTADTIAYPAGDDRAYSIMAWFSKDGNFDEREWKSGLSVVRKVGNYSLSTYLGFMFGKVTQPAADELKRRIDIYFDLLNSSRLGLPRPIEYNPGFFEMMEGLHGRHDLRLYVYEKYGSKLATESEFSTGLHLSYLKKMYGEENDPLLKEKIIGWIVRYFNDHPYKKSPEQLYDFAYGFEQEPNPENNHYKTERNSEKRAHFPEKDLQLLVTGCRDRFAEYATATPYVNQQEDRINFCIRHGIALPGLIPTLAEAEDILKGNDIESQLKVMKLLVQMGEKVRPLENTLVTLLGRKSIEFKDELQETQLLAVSILGSLKTANQNAIVHMISKLTSFDYRESETAAGALTSIGKPAVSPLIAKLNSTTDQDGGLRYKIIVILGKIGKDAKPATPTLRKLLANTSNSDVRYAIEATLQSFGD